MVIWTVVGFFEEGLRNHQSLLHLETFDQHDQTKNAENLQSKV
jgi:hypothetical protein